MDYGDDSVDDRVQIKVKVIGEDFIADFLTLTDSSENLKASLEVNGEIQEFDSRAEAFKTFIDRMSNIYDSKCIECGACGYDECCPYSMCKYSQDYISDIKSETDFHIEELKKELAATRKTLSEYIKMLGFEVNEDILDREIKFYG